MAIFPKANQPKRIEWTIEAKSMQLQFKGISPPTTSVRRLEYLIEDTIDPAGNTNIK